MKNTLICISLMAMLVPAAFAQGLSDGALQLSINALRSEGGNFSSSIASGNYVSAPIRLGYKLNEQYVLFGGIATRSVAQDNGTTEDTDVTTVFTVGAQATMTSGLMLEGSWTRLMLTEEDGGQEADYVGNHFEAFLGRRFQFENGLYVEPKAGATFGTLELDDNNANVSVSDGLGSEFSLTLGYVL